MKKVLLTLIGLIAVGSVQAVDPNLYHVTPNGFQRGTEVTASFSGRRLTDAEEILLYEPGVKVLSIDNGRFACAMSIH